MSLIQTPICDFSKSAIDFELKDTNGNLWNLSKVRGVNGTLIMFICNHCPYVQAILTELIKDVAMLKDNGIGCAAIMSNDTNAYPEDNFKNMGKTAKKYEFTFPYLLDETQEIAKAYGAVCTPDFFGFNKNLELQYRGRFNAAGANLEQTADSNSKHELLDAMLLIAESNKGPVEQIPSMGCSIKWK